MTRYFLTASLCLSTWRSTLLLNYPKYRPSPTYNDSTYDCLTLQLCESDAHSVEILLPIFLKISFDVYFYFLIWLCQASVAASRILDLCCGLWGPLAGAQKLLAAAYGIQFPAQAPSAGLCLSHWTTSDVPASSV